MNAGQQLSEEIKTKYKTKLCASMNPELQAYVLRMVKGTSKEDPDKVVEVKEYPTEGFSHDALLADIPENECRYILEHFLIHKDDGSVDDRIVYILYCPNCKNIIFILFLFSC